VTLVEAGGQYRLIAAYGEGAWVRNARAAGRVTLRHVRHVETVTLMELRPDETAPILKRHLIRVPITRPFFAVTPESSLEAFVAKAPVFPIKPPKGFEALTTAVVERCTMMIVSALSKTFREGEVNRAERRRDRVPRHDPSSSRPDIGQVSAPPARVSAHMTLGARHSAETMLVPTSARLTTPFKIRGTLVNLRSMATGRRPAI
jgi:hypothetical protein